MIEQLSTIGGHCDPRCLHNMSTFTFEAECYPNLLDPDLSSRLSACKCYNALGCSVKRMTRLFVESETGTYHGRPGAGRRTAGRRGEAGPGRTGRRRVGSPRRQPSLLLSRASRASKTTVLNDSPEARTNEILCKLIEEHNEPLFRWTRAALRSWLLTNGPSPTLSL